ncbi:methylated-DNA--[protein]-cysteine S-methyltransferase [Lacihabitans lacunae]|uniref:Methylated-DNA--protein-cysteine methyltransferase n=1 Tax=Lacihabitans lacunae TaxID=1028214 RepID=A0ABV7Z0U3_9BACT
MSAPYHAFVQVENTILKIETDDVSVKTISFVKNIEENSPETPPILKDAVIQLEKYLMGKLQEFELILNPDGTDFQKKVWNTLLTIPYGATCSYADMANSLGDPKVIRAAASANGKNPIAIVIPCHRVIGTNGSLTGYAGGLNNKRLLLDLENKVANGVMTLF